MTRSLTLSSLLACVLCAPAALAADGETTKLDLPADEVAKTVAVTPGAGGGDLMRAVIGLTIVVAVIYGLYWILKQVKSSREEQRSGQGLQALATLPLGPNRSLHLVSAGREVVLVGVAEHGVAPIRTYTEAEARSLGLLGPDPLTAAAPADEPRWQPAQPQPHPHHTPQEVYEQDLAFTLGVMDDSPYGATDGSHQPPAGSWIDQLRRRTVIR